MNTYQSTKSKPRKPIGDHDESKYHDTRAYLRDGTTNCLKMKRITASALINI